MTVYLYLCVCYFFQHAIDHAKDDILAYGGVSVTDVTWVMVITWSNMIPRLYYSELIETVSMWRKNVRVINASVYSVIMEVAVSYTT